MRYTREFWEANAHKSGEQIAREQGMDGGSMRRIIREAKAEKEYRDLDWFGGVPAPTHTTVRKGIGVFDLHHPSHNKKLWRNILRYTADLNPDVFVFGGDNEDLEVVSHWVGNRRLRVEGQRLKTDYARFNRDVLDPVSDLLSDDAERIFLLGNHEDWVRQYIEEHPEMEGLIELEEHLHLDGWDVYEYGHVAKVGKLHFMHGEFINIHNAMKTAQVYGRNIVYGHGHTYQAHTITAPLDVESHTATQIPCACDLNPHYRRNKPNTWVNGFCVFYIQPNGNYNLYPVIAVDGAFVTPDGTLYE